jgi:hypothetical protein
MLRRHLREVIEHAVKISRCLNGMGQDIVDMIPARCKSSQWFELWQERGEEAEGVHELEMIFSIPLSKDQEKLVPQALGRGLGNEPRPTSDMLSSHALNSKPECCFKSHGT